MCLLYTCFTNVHRIRQARKYNVVVIVSYQVLQLLPSFVHITCTTIQGCVNKLKKYKSCTSFPTTTMARHGAASYPATWTLMMERQNDGCVLFVFIVGTIRMQRICGENGLGKLSFHSQACAMGATALVYCTT